MIKASVLYLVVVVSLIITIILSSLIVTGYFYRLEYQKSLRALRLDNNLGSGIALVSSTGYKQDSAGMALDLYGQSLDSIWLKKERWGIYEQACVKAFQLQDTLKKAFFLGAIPDDQVAVYLTDENRPLSLSGNTRITGDAELPKSGIRQAYVEGRPYLGKELVYGKIRTSQPTLPELNPQVLQTLEKIYALQKGGTEILQDSLANSFFNASRLVYLGKRKILDQFSARGKLLLVSDSNLVIKKAAVLENVIVVAPSIVFEDGFHGTGQFFARDSIVTGHNCLFTYPSALGVCKFTAGQGQPKVVLGEECLFRGILFSYEKKRSELQTLVSLGKSSVVEGEIYAAGLLKMTRPAEVDGKVSCRRFIIQTKETLYENYLLDITLNRAKLSPFYLSSNLFYKNVRQDILKWLQ